MAVRKITLIGPPGTGKTTALTHIYKYLTAGEDKDFIERKGLDKVITKHYNMTQIVFTTFTTSARSVLVERGVENVYTLHSYVSKLLHKNGHLTGKNFMKDPFRTAMIENGYGWDFRDRHSNHPSNVAATKYVYYFNTYYNLDDNKILKIIAENEPTTISGRIESYVAWRKENNVVDYTEVMRMFMKKQITNFEHSKEAEEPAVFIFDEVQDFSPLQWAVVHKLLSHASVELAIAAGDYNQSIYSFQGARPEEFLKFRDESFVVTLDRSYRLPQAVYVTAEMLTRKMGTHVEYSPKEKRGTAKKFFMRKSELQKFNENLVEEVLNIIKRAEENNKTVFVLLRTNAMARKFEKNIIKAGYKVKRIKNDITSLALIEEARTFEIEKIILDDLYYAVMSLDDRGVQLMKELGFDGANQLSDFFIGKLGTGIDNVFDETIREAADYFERNYLKIFDKDELEILEMLRRDGLRDFTVYVDTMHAAKGEEADVVIVIDYVNKKVMKDIKESRERLFEEMRLLYVAMTRAREELYVFSSNSKRSILSYTRF